MSKPKLDQDLIQDLAMLHENARFRRVVAHIREMSREADTNAILTSTEPDVARGRARGLRETLDLLDNRRNK